MPAARAVRRRRAGPPTPHPFAADAGALASALDAASEWSRRPGGDAAELLLTLPSSRGGPAASPFLLRVGAGDGQVHAPDRLATWSVSAIRLDGRTAFDVLIAASDAPAVRERTAGDVLIADDLRFLGELAKLVLVQVAQGGVAPLLERAGPGFIARWSPVAGGPIATQLARLRDAMPASLRAADPERPSADLVDCAFEALADACARAALDVSRASPPKTSASTRGRGGRTANGVPAQEWLDALALPSGRIASGNVALDRMGVALADWIRPLVDATTRSLRTCFRLNAPDDAAAESDTWHLEFLLQAADDATLLVPAATVWRTRGRVLSAAGRRQGDPQERLLEDLGRAMRLFPPIESALREATPTGVMLDMGEAHAFLSNAAATLEQAGFGVLVPAWWGGPGARFGLQLRARPASSSSSSSGLLGLDAACAYDWRVAIGDETLTEAEFLELARLKQPLVRMRGRWVELRSADIEALRALIGRDGDRAMTVRELLRAGAGVAPAAAGLPVVSLSAEGWIGELLASTERDRVRPAATPTGFGGELRPYQQRGLGWLAFLDRLGIGACLADDMGLGKTIQLLALLVDERNGPTDDRSIPDAERQQPGGAPTLLVCPMSVVGNWQREAARFAPRLRVHVHHGGERLGGEAFAGAALEADLVLTTYALAARDRDVLASVEWRRIVLDEAQNIKNSATRQAQALRSLAASRRVALTGTPVENRLAELWSILDFLNPGLLGSQRSFRERFATPIERYGDDNRAAALRRITAPFILRRVKTDRTIIDDLPDKIEIKEFCNLTREQASLYQAVVDDMMQKIETSEGIERRGHVLAAMLRLKQVCNHPAHLMGDGSTLEGRSGKLERLEEVLDEAIGGGERALVFTQFAEWGRLLHGHLQHRLAREVAFLHGGTSRTERDRLVERFQSGDGAPVLLLSLKAGGTGLNLTAANHVVHFDRWWNPAVEEQATDRAFRIGQTRNVQVRKFVCAGTLEERIDAMIERKKALAERIVGTGEAWLTELSTEELRQIVALSADAVAE